VSIPQGYGGGTLPFFTQNAARFSLKTRDITSDEQAGSTGYGDRPFRIFAHPANPSAISAVFWPQYIVSLAVYSWYLHRFA
jgi:hypothetical protein